MNPGQWVGKYVAKAEALIELFGDPRLCDCGFVGGFDVGAGGDSMHGLLYLEQRFEALKPKYAPKKAKKKNGTIADK